MSLDFERELNWALGQMPRTRAAVAALPDLHGVRLACSMHLDLKMVPLVAGLLNKGAAVYLTTCNPTTVQDEVVAWLERHGAQAFSWRDMDQADWVASFDRALAWGRPICVRWAPI